MICLCRKLIRGLTFATNVPIRSQLVLFQAKPKKTRTKIFVLNENEIYRSQLFRSRCDLFLENDIFFVLSFRSFEELFVKVPSEKFLLDNLNMW